MIRDGRIRPSDRMLDELIGAEAVDREQITLRHLLTHTSGFDAYENYHLRFPERGAKSKIIADIAQRRFRNMPSEKFVYSDLGFITLGAVVERAAGTDLNSFCRREIFEPLGMKDTMFNPPASLRARIAPTEWRTLPTTATAVGQKKTDRNDAAGRPVESPRSMIRGEVHDGNAYVQDGISGHAGLFSTARDLSRYCQMLLNEGEYEGVRIFSPLTVRSMQEDKAGLDNGPKRSFGWDVGSSYSGQRGDLFNSGFGHTGWTGTSVWIVPEEELFIIILSNRVHPDGTGDAGPLRSKVANVVAVSLLETKKIIRYQGF
jgi:serine-type D-Ala-D-Ala carboxypeptidase